MEITRNKQRLHRAHRVRAHVSGTTVRPRLSVFRSLRSLSVQLIDDTKNVTIASARLEDVKGAKNTVADAEKLGALIGKKAMENKITEIVFDRAGYKYHGKIKAVAEGARSAGLKF